MDTIAIYADPLRSKPSDAATAAPKAAPGDDGARPANRPARGAAAGPTLAGDAGFAMLARVLYLTTRLALPPMILAHISLADYGLWSACFVLVAYVALAEFGLSSVYVRFVSRLYAQRDTDAIGRLLSTGIVCMFGIGAVVMTVVVAAMPALTDLLKVDEASRRTASLLLAGTAAVFVCDMALSAFGHALHGLQRVRSEQRVWVASFLIEFVLIVSLLAAGLGLVGLLAAFAIRTAASFTANLFALRRALPGLKLGPHRFDRSMLRHFAGFGLAVQASTLLSVALHSADRMIAGSLLGPQAIALFDLGGKLPQSAASIPSSISKVTLPRAALSERGRDAAPLLMRATRAVALLASLPLSFLAVFAAPMSAAWLGPREELAVLPPIVSALAAAAFFHVITGPGSAVFRGTGQVGNEFVYSGLRIAGIGAGVSVACALGGVSAQSIAIGLACGAIVAALLYLSHNQRRIGLAQRALWARVIAPAVLPLAPALALAAAWHAWMPSGLTRWETLAALAAFGLIHCALAAALLWHGLDAGERDTLRALARRRRG